MRQYSGPCGSCLTFIWAIGLTTYSTSAAQTGGGKNRPTAQTTGIAARAANGTRTHVSLSALFGCHPMPEMAAPCLSGLLNFGLAFPPFFLCGLVLGSLRGVARKTERILALSVRGMRARHGSPRVAAGNDACGHRAPGLRSSCPLNPAP